MIFAALLLAQRPTASQLLGGLLILAGIAVVQRGSRTRDAAAPRPVEAVPVSRA